MRLTTDSNIDIPDVDAKTMDSVLREDAFGKFAVLESSADEFIQAANEWHASAACEAFLAEHGSDPWVLEYREAGWHFRADAWVTLTEVRTAFAAYLTGETAWRSAWLWSEMPDSEAFPETADGSRYHCPCCRCLTLPARADYDICPICFWEDDGQDDPNAGTVHGGPNGTLSLTVARANYREFGACERRLVGDVRPPTPNELRLHDR